MGVCRFFVAYTEPTLERHSRGCVSLVWVAQTAHRTDVKGDKTVWGIRKTDKPWTRAPWEAHGRAGLRTLVGGVFTSLFCRFWVCTQNPQQTYRSRPQLGPWEETYKQNPQRKNKGKTNQGVRRKIASLRLWGWGEAPRSSPPGACGTGKRCRSPGNPRPWACRPRRP